MITLEHKTVKNDITEISKLLSLILDLKDSYTADHSKVVRTVSVFLGKKIKINKAHIVHLNIGGYMHDIGKISVPDEILFKPGKLDKEEFDKIKDHTSFGGQFLDKFTDLKRYKDIVLYHHEKYNGTGYPFGLAGEEIPIEARIITIADVYHALHSKRCYKEAFEKDRIIEEFRIGRKTHFDPYLADEIIDSLVSGEIDLLLNEPDYLEEFELEIQDQLHEVFASEDQDEEDVLLEMVDVLTSALDIMNPPYADHCKNVKKTAQLLAEKMRLDQKTIDSIVLAASLHDIGRLGQRTGLAQVGTVDNHMTLGAEMLSMVNHFKEILPMVRHHHEFFDGTGIPDRIHGHDIPLGARIICVADHFDAFCKRKDVALDRNLTKLEAREKMKALSGTLFDPEIISVFSECTALFMV